MAVLLVAGRPTVNICSSLFISFVYFTTEFMEFPLFTCQPSSSKSGCYLTRAWQVCFYFQSSLLIFLEYFVYYLFFVSSLSTRQHVYSKSKMVSYPPTHTSSIVSSGVVLVWLLQREFQGSLLVQPSHGRTYKEARGATKRLLLALPALFVIYCYPALLTIVYVSLCLSICLFSFYNKSIWLCCLQCMTICTVYLVVVRLSVYLSIYSAVLYIRRALTIFGLSVCCSYIYLADCLAICTFACLSVGVVFDCMYVLTICMY